MSAGDEAGGPAGGPGETKLTRTKQAWAREGRFLTGRDGRAAHDRLPPGQHLVKDWPVLDLGQQPEVPLERWRLEIGGLVQTPAVWDWAAFTARATATRVSDIHCVTTWSRFDNAWQGVATGDLIAAAGVAPEARFVTVESHDGYTTNLPLADFAAPDAILAHTWQGQPLARAHGGPVRLVVPHLYFWKSAKWVRRIAFHAADHPGFWERRGYHERGDPWAEQRYADS